MSHLLQRYNPFSQQRTTSTANVTAPTFEDLSIDDTLTELQRLVRYMKSSIGLQRLVHVKMIADVAHTVGFEDTMTFILPLLDELSHDSEPAIKQQLVEQLGLLGALLADNGEMGYKALVESILPLTARLLEDTKTEVRQTAAATLVKIAGLVRSDDLGQHVLTIVLRLAHEDNKEEMRMTAAQLLNLLAECLGQDLCKQFVIPEVVSLAEDPVFRVRKSTALNFHHICRIGGDYELFERLMPAFVRLSKDDMYRVRRACAESVFAISEHVSDDIRIGVLVEIYLRFAQDPARLVKQSILQQSGMFISTLPTSVVNETVLGHYISMASDPTGDLAVDAELKHYCAFSFPAVLQTITKLVPVFEELIQDVESVQMGVMANLAQFLTFLTEPCRISYLPELHNILHATNPFNWRLRQCLAIQLPVLLNLPPSDSIYVTLFPLVMTLLQDPVATVKRSSFRDGRRHQQQFESVLKAVNGLALGDKYQSRQLWADLCLVLLKFLPREVFEKYFIDGLLLSVMDNISDDDYKSAPASDAALKNGEFMHKTSPWIWFLERDDIKECTQRLRRDHHDIVLCLGRILPIFPELQLETISCRGMKEAPGGTEPILNCMSGVSCTDSFQKLYGISDRESTASEVSSVGTFDIDLETAHKRLSGKQELASLQNAMSAGLAGREGSASSDQDEADLMGAGSGSASPPRSTSPSLEDAMEMEEHILLVAPSDRSVKLEIEENQSSDPEFMPVQDKEGMNTMPPPPDNE
eukprot:GSChrysophyteH2.ASY1.ANO1.1455.1 assembled CDS